MPEHATCVDATRTFFNSGSSAAVSTDKSQVGECAAGSKLVACCVKGFTDPVYSCVRLENAESTECTHPGMRGRAGGVRLQPSSGVVKDV